MTKHLVFFIADGFQPLDLFGPLDTYMEANSIVPNAYQAVLMGLQAGPVKSASGTVVIAEVGLADTLAIDYLIICGGCGMRQLILNLEQQQKLRALADKADKVLSICTGAFILAKLYQDCSFTLTTHWRHCQELAKAAPHCQVQAKPLYVSDGKLWSSAGVLAGVDLSLEIIRQDLGNTVAASVAKELVIYMQRKGGQAQYSDLLKVQSGDSLRLSPLLEWLLQNLDKPITVQQMADRAALSERQLTRLFMTHLSATPGHYLRELRLSRARDLLASDNLPMDKIAAITGFASYDSFRRAFAAHFGVSPSFYHQNK